MQSSPPPPIDPDVFDDHLYFFDWSTEAASGLLSGKRADKRAWPETRLSELRRLWHEGVYAKDIGAALGVSKSAVLGMASRIGLPSRCSKTDFKPRNVRKSSGKFVKVDA
jgi:hypothetical protein